MRILLTGGTGFIGRAFATAAAAAGDVVAFAGRNLAGSGQGWPVDLQSGEGLDRVPWREFDAVVHLAAAGVKVRRRQWGECIMVNVVGTRRLLDAITTAGAHPTVWIAQTFYEAELASSPKLLENPYIATKHAGSELARDWAHRTGGTLVFGRLFQAYGPGDDSGNVLSYTVERLLRREQALFGSGRPRRDWIFVDDVAAGIRACLLAAGPGTETFDLGSGTTVSLRDVIERLAEIAGAPRSLVDFSASRDREDVTLDLRATRPPPGWRPQVELDAGLRQLVAAGNAVAANSSR